MRRLVHPTNEQFREVHKLDIKNALRARVRGVSENSLNLRIYNPKGGWRDEVFEYIPQDGDSRLRLGLSDRLLIWEKQGIILLSTEWRLLDPDVKWVKLDPEVIARALAPEPELTREEHLRQLLTETGASPETVESTVRSLLGSRAKQR